MSSAPLSTLVLFFILSLLQPVMVQPALATTQDNGNLLNLCHLTKDIPSKKDFQKDYKGWAPFEAFEFQYLKDIQYLEEALLEAATESLDLAFSPESPDRAFDPESSEFAVFATNPESSDPADFATNPSSSSLAGFTPNPLLENYLEEGFTLLNIQNVYICPQEIDPEVIEVPSVRWTDSGNGEIRTEEFTRLGVSFTVLMSFRLEHRKKVALGLTSKGSLEGLALVTFVKLENSPFLSPTKINLNLESRGGLDSLAREINFGNLHSTRRDISKLFYLSILNQLNNSEDLAQELLEVIHFDPNAYIHLSEEDLLTP